MDVEEWRPPNTSTDVWLCTSVMLLTLAVVMLLTLAVVLPTPYDYSGTFQGGYSARFIVSRRVLKGARKALSPFKISLGSSAGSG